MVTLRKSVRHSAGSSASKLTRSADLLMDSVVPILPSALIATDPFVDFTDSSSSPFSLHSADRLGLALIAIQLNGSNYNHWSSAMLIALDAKNKIAFIDDSLPCPCEGRYMDLHNRFHTTNLPRTFHLIQQIQDLCQSSMDLSSYYTALTTLWDQLDGSEPREMCLCCNTFNCPSQRAAQAKVDRGRITKFLAGLNESYSIIRGQIIMKKPLPDIAEIYNILDQDDSQRKFGTSVVPAAFQVGNVGHLPGVLNAAVLHFKTKE